MESDSLYYLRNQFYKGNFKHLINNPLPSSDSDEYLGILCYTARSHIALQSHTTALKILPESSEDPSIKVLRVLASFFAATGSKDTYLDQLRDILIEVEEGYEGDESEGVGTSLVKVASASAFIVVGEYEEALTTLGAGCKSRDLECVQLIIHAYLLINRPDLARKEYEAAKKWADDSILLQMIEASLSMFTGGQPLETASYIYAEQASAPGSSTNASILTSRALTAILMGVYGEAENELNEALSVDPKFDDALAAKVVLAELSGKSKTEVEGIFSKLQEANPDHPLVQDLFDKADIFDKAAAQFTASAAA
ncbi:hypothetical protein FRC03_009560 [Tulasnella sp. 419]|nr:hypothetical protein FRC03_009560 [Tulasnella sp. 419]